MARDLPLTEPRANSGALIHDLRRELRLVMGSLDGLIAKLEQIERGVAILEGRGTGCAGPAPHGHVAHNLDIQSQPNGSAEVVIDGGRKFSLGPRLAEVFEFLASGEKDYNGADPLVGWRSRTEILLFLKDATGKDFRRSYVNNMVHLLKKALRDAGYDRSLIQTHRQKGIRFAFKRGAQGLLKALPPGS